MEGQLEACGGGAIIRDLILASNSNENEPGEKRGMRGERCSCGNGLTGMRPPPSAAARELARVLCCGALLLHECGVRTA